jgi:RNA polymerase sigma factor (sigma-70 family)
MTETNHDDMDDLGLLARVRAGDRDAVAALYTRHRPAALIAARSLAGRTQEAEDLVQDAFTSVVAAIEHGAGPDESVRAYLLSAVRNSYYRSYRRAQRLVPTDDLDILDQIDPDGDDPADRASNRLDSRLIVAAFRTLPSRWQRVLWRTEVDGVTAAELAAEFEVSANSAAALVYRARNALAQAFLNAHLDVGVARECTPFVPRLAAWVRSDLTARRASAVSDHVRTCESCTALIGELAVVNDSLRAAGPLLVGLPALAGAAGGHGGLAAMVGGHHLTALVAKFGGWTTPVKVAVVAGALSPLAVAVAVAVVPRHSVAPALAIPARSSAPAASPSPIAPAAPIASAASSPSTAAGSPPSAGPPVAGVASAGAPVLPTSKLVRSIAPAPIPLQLTVADRGSAQTFTLVDDLRADPQPELRVSALPTGWRVELSGTGGVNCQDAGCTLPASGTTAATITADFAPDATAIDGTVEIAVYASARSATPVTSYVVELSS